MRKIMTGLGIALTALTLTLTNPTSTEAKTKYVTAKDAGKKIASLQKRCYEKKIKKTITFNFKAKNYSKAWDFIDKAYAETARIEYGKAYRTNFKKLKGSNKYVRFSFCKKGFKSATENWISWLDFDLIEKGKGKFCYKVTIKGKDKKFRFEYKEIEYAKKLINEVTSITKDMGEFDKAYAVMLWLRCRAAYYQMYHKDLTMAKLYERGYLSDCDQLADLYTFFAKCAGVKHVGTVCHGNHMWNWIQVGKTKYYIDFQDGGPYSRQFTIRETIKEMMDPLDDGNWDFLYNLNEWYKENIDANAKDFDNCKALYDSLTEEQREVFDKSHRNLTKVSQYELTCNTYSKIYLLPKEVYCNNSHPLKTYKDWIHVEH